MSGFADSEAFGHLFVEEASTRPVGLHPLPVDHELRDGSFAGALDDFLGGAGRRLDVDLFIANVVLGQKTFGFAAIGTPKG